MILNTTISYRNASIGSNTAALIAGYNQEAMATMKLVKAAIIAPHGITNAQNPSQLQYQIQLGFQK
jgi:hypothetical protein